MYYLVGRHIGHLCMLWHYLGCTSLWSVLQYPSTLLMAPYQLVTHDWLSESHPLTLAPPAGEFGQTHLTTELGNMTDTSFTLD